jgi:hypothetical protein
MTKQQDWEKEFKNLYFNWEKNNDFFRCVLVPFVKNLLSQEKEKWETAVQYNVDAETWDRIRDALHALNKPILKNN